MSIAKLAAISEICYGLAESVSARINAVDEVTFLDRDVRTPAFGLHTSRVAWHFKKYSTDINLEMDEITARDRKLGLVSQ